MTNGEKLVKVFPDIELYKKMHGGIQIDFDSTWWNAEYQEPTTKNDLAVDGCIHKCIDKLTEDCISRADVLKLMQDNWHTHNGDWAMQESMDDIRALPSVTPQEPKTGHWIPTYGNVKCSVCGSVKDSREVGKATHYCDFCGAKMVEPQERSE